MRLVNTTNTHPELVKEQLENTDAHLVETYSLGNTSIVYTQAKTHENLILVNKKRALKENEIDFVIQRLFHTTRKNPRLEMIRCDYFIEISLEK